MVVKSQIKLIKSLRRKKYRKEHGLFVAEGAKMVGELCNSSLRPYGIYVTDEGLLEKRTEIVGVERVSPTDMEKMSALTTSNGVLGIFYVPEPTPLDFSDWILALDDIADPGNLGTIIRLCDWFGIRHLLCSPRTVDAYNPKVLQATMGSIARVNLVYGDLAGILAKEDTPVYGAFMGGKSVYDEKMPRRGVLLMGNEAHGISSQLKTIINKRITIPQYGQKTTESLNVATATAILLNEVRRGI